MPFVRVCYKGIIMMLPWRLFVLSILTVLGDSSRIQAQWLTLTNVTTRIEQSELGGSHLSIEYDLIDTNITAETPAYVFIHHRKRPAQSWRLLSPRFLQGRSILDSPGHKKSIWWGIDRAGITNADQVEIRIRGLAMCRIPAGIFRLKSMPGAGHDASKSLRDPAFLSTYFVARCETTIGMYADYLNEMSLDGAGWNPKMRDEKRCGLDKTGPGSYQVLPGRANHPINYISWYDAAAFLEWCGLRLPTEAEWEKALRGGLYLDGDDAKRMVNPWPERPFPWGGQSPDAGGVFRCNCDGDQDGFPFTAPVGSFSKFDSPYGVCDLSGNVAEWTLDWYETSYHAGLDGFRIVRGGSWMDPPAGVDAVSAPTSLPLKTSGIMGFRAVFVP